MSLTDRLARIEARLTSMEGATTTQVGSLIVVETPDRLSVEQRDHMRHALDEAMRDTGLKAIVLDGGTRLARPTDEQIAEVKQAVERMEAKLDALLDALDAEAGDGEDTPALTLDGEQVGGERDSSQSLDG